MERETKLQSLGLAVLLLFLSSCVDYTTYISKANLDKKGLTLVLKLGTIGPREPIAILLCIAPDQNSFAPLTYDGAKVGAAKLDFLDKGLSCPIAFSAMRAGLADSRTGKLIPRPATTVDLKALLSNRSTRCFIDNKLLSTNALAAAKQGRLVAVVAYGVLNAVTLEVDCRPVTLAP